MMSEKMQELHSRLTDRLSITLVTIIIAAGCAKNHADAHRQFMQSVGEQVFNVVKMAVRLNKVMGEEVVSADLVPVSATAGNKFDSSTMEDFAGQVDQQAGKLVLCTTALGVYRSDKAMVGDSFELKTIVLKRPKVALESVADGLRRDDTHMESANRGNQGRFSRVVFDWFWAWFWGLVLVDFWSAKTKVLV